MLKPIHLRKFQDEVEKAKKRGKNRKGNQAVSACTRAGRPGYFLIKSHVLP